MKSYKIIRDGKIAEYDKNIADNASFWSSHWGSNAVKDVLKKSRSGYIGGMNFLTSEIRKSDKILEAGCGKGQIVCGLQAKNYDIEGVDFSKDIIDQIMIEDPSLKVSHGDLRSLKYIDNYFSIYLSLGVIEHFNKKEDLDKLISEAKRVTSRLLFFGVPYLSNIVKKNLVKLNRYQNGQGEFYQYYFDYNEIESLLLQYGLKVVKVDYYATYIGLKRYNYIFSFLEKFYVFRFVFFRIRRLLDILFGRKYAHMIGLWVKKIKN